MQLNILNKLLEYNILQTLLHIIALCSGRKSTERWWGCCLRIYVCKPHIPMIFSIQNWVTSFNANKLKVKNYREIFRPSQLAKMFCENWINTKTAWPGLDLVSTRVDPITCGLVQMWMPCWCIVIWSDHIQLVRAANDCILLSDVCECVVRRTMGRSKTNPNPNPIPTELAQFKAEDDHTFLFLFSKAPVSNRSDKLVIKVTC